MAFKGILFTAWAFIHNSYKNGYMRQFVRLYGVLCRSVKLGRRCVLPRRVVWLLKGFCSAVGISSAGLIKAGLRSLCGLRWRVLGLGRCDPGICCRFNSVCCRRRCRGSCCRSWEFRSVVALSDDLLRVLGPFFCFDIRPAFLGVSLPVWPCFCFSGVMLTCEFWQDF